MFFYLSSVVSSLSNSFLLHNINSIPIPVVPGPTPRAQSLHTRLCKLYKRRNCVPFNELERFRGIVDALSLYIVGEVPTETSISSFVYTKQNRVTTCVLLTSHLSSTSSTEIIRLSVDEPGGDGVYLTWSKHAESEST